MGLKTFTITQDTLSTSKHCRLDPKYSSFTNVHDWIVFEALQDNLWVKITQILLFYLFIAMKVETKKYCLYQHGLA